MNLRSRGCRPSCELMGLGLLEGLETPHLKRPMGTKLILNNSGRGDSTVRMRNTKLHKNIGFQ